MSHTPAPKSQLVEEFEREWRESCYQITDDEDFNISKKNYYERAYQAAALNSSVTRMLEDALKKIGKCQCDARFSGVDHQEWLARGAPTCSCSNEKIINSALRQLAELREACK